MSIFINLESSDLDIIAIFIHTTFSCICTMSGGGPSHRFDCPRHRSSTSISDDVTSRDRVTLVLCHTLQHNSSYCTVVRIQDSILDRHDHHNNVGDNLVRERILNSRRTKINAVRHYASALSSRALHTPIWTLTKLRLHLPSINI